MVKMRMSNHLRLLVYKILQELLDMLLLRDSPFPYDQDGCPYIRQARKEKRTAAQ